MCIHDQFHWPPAATLEYQSVLTTHRPAEKRKVNITINDWGNVLLKSIYHIYINTYIYENVL